MNWPWRSAHTSLTASASRCCLYSRAHNPASSRTAWSEWWAERQTSGRFPADDTHADDPHRPSHTPPLNTAKHTLHAAPLRVMRENSSTNTHTHTHIQDLFVGFGRCHFSQNFNSDRYFHIFSLWDPQTLGEKQERDTIQVHSFWIVACFQKRGGLEIYLYFTCFFFFYSFSSKKVVSSFVICKYFYLKYLFYFWTIISLLSACIHFISLF